MQVQSNEHTTRHSYCQTGNIYQTVKFTFQQISPGDLKIVTEHGLPFYLQRNKQCAIPEMPENRAIPGLRVFKYGQKVYGIDTVPIL
jgi:hypothetical protein